MSTNKPFTAAQLVQLIDNTSNLRASQYFHTWLDQLFRQVGGPNAMSNTELTKKLIQAEEDIVELIDRADVSESTVNQINIILANVANALNLDINGLGQVSARLSLDEAVSYLGLWNHI